MTGFPVRALIFALLLLPFGQVEGQTGVRISDSTVRWKVFDYELSPQGAITRYHTNRTVVKNFWVKVIENDLIKVTLLPEFGGRVLSYIYKPTGREMLYQNPVGTVFGLNANNFYYNYLMVYGGIFPTFPEPEHGKTWNQPWEITVLTNTREKVSVRMRYRDRIENSRSTPVQFRHGRTDLVCSVVVTVRDGSSLLEYAVSLENTRDQRLDYEYWTCMTLAPGSEPGRAAATGSTELVIPHRLARLKSEWWDWMTDGNAGEHHHDNVWVLNRLTFYSNWQDMGILYAYPSVTNSWYGVINHDNLSGFFRVADNARHTPGLKVWTWGLEPAARFDGGNGTEARRPFIEYWAGHSSEFFQPAAIKPGEIKSWTEYFLPTQGLPFVSQITEHGALALRVDHPSRTNISIITAEFFPASPGESVFATMMISGKKSSRMIYGKEIPLSPSGPARMTALVTNASLKRGSYSLELTIQKKSGEVLVKTSRPFIN